MIEEFIDQSIPPMVVEDFGQQTITKEGFRQFQAKLDPQEIRRRLDKWAAREWEVDILLPVMSETGAADPTLVIQLNKLDKWPLSPADRDKPIAKVRVSYGVNRQLEIKGEEVIFKGTIPSDGQERLEIIETALTKAIDQPEPLPRPRIYRNLGHNIPIRAGAY